MWKISPIFPYSRPSEPSLPLPSKLANRALVAVFLIVKFPKYFLAVRQLLLVDISS